MSEKHAIEIYRQDDPAKTNSGFTIYASDSPGAVIFSVNIDGVASQWICDASSAVQAAVAIFGHFKDHALLQLALRDALERSGGKGAEA